MLVDWKVPAKLVTKVFFEKSVEGIAVNVSTPEKV
jgi:hypothetical protein